MDTVKIINKKEWSELAEIILAKFIVETEAVWSQNPPKEWLKKQAEEIAEYRFKSEKFKIMGDLATSKVYEDTLNMVLSQVEARIKEIEIHVKKGMLDFLKDAISVVLKFAVGVAIPLL